LNEEQLDFFYYKLSSYFEDASEKDEQIKVCCREISKLRDKLDINQEDEPEEETRRPYDFKAVLLHLETLKTLREKIAYLTERRISFQQSIYSTLSEIPSFDRKCSLEIEKLEKLARLQPIPQPKIIEVGKHRDLTLDRAIFLLNRLIPFFLDCDATKKAEFIHFLTGFDYETARQRFSSINKKDAEKPQAFEKDMEIVCKYLEVLGLTDITREIKNDLKFR
jgi:hypothetical protein